MDERTAISDLERRLAKGEAALRNSEENYRAVCAAIDEGFCIWDVALGADRRVVDLCFTPAET